MRLVGHHIPRERAIDPEHAATCKECRATYDERELVFGRCIPCETDIQEEQALDAKEEMDGRERTAA